MEQAADYVIFTITDEHGTVLAVSSECHSLKKSSKRAQTLVERQSLTHGRVFRTDVDTTFHSSAASNICTQLRKIHRLTPHKDAPETVTVTEESVVRSRPAHFVSRHVSTDKNGFIQYVELNGVNVPVLINTSID